MQSTTAMKDFTWLGQSFVNAYLLAGQGKSPSAMVIYLLISFSKEDMHSTHLFNCPCLSTAVLMTFVGMAVGKIYSLKK